MPPSFSFFFLNNLRSNCEYFIFTLGMHLHHMQCAAEEERDAGTITVKEKQKGDNNGEEKQVCATSMTIDRLLGGLCSQATFLSIAGREFKRPTMTWRVIWRVVGRGSNSFNSNGLKLRIFTLDIRYLGPVQTVLFDYESSHFRTLLLWSI